VAERQTRTVVGYDVDRASIQKVVIGNQAIRNSIEGVRDVLGDLGASTASGVNMLNTRFDLLGRNIQDDLRIVEDLHQELRDLDNVVVEPEIRVQQTNTGSAARRNSSGIETTDRLGSIGSQILSGLGQGELANAAGLVGDVAGSIGSLGIAGGAAAIALGAVTVAMGEYNRQLDVQKKALDSAFTAQDRYIEALKNLNSEQAQAALDTELENRRFLVIEANNTQAAIWEAWDQSVATFGEAGARALQALGQLPTTGLQTRLDELNGQIGVSEGYLIRLRAGLENGAFAAQDAAEAEVRLAAEREKLANVTVSAAVRADSLTSDQRENRIDEITREIELLQLFGGTSAETQAQIANLTAETDGLRMVFNSAADAAAELAARTESMSTQSDNYLDAITAEVSAQEKAFEARQEYAKAVAEGAAKERELATETAEKRAEIVTDSRDRLTEIEERGAKDRAKILRDYSRTYTQAVGERDALAGKNAQIAAADRIADQQESYDEQLRTQTKALDKQLRALDKSYNDQYARLIQGINAEITTRQMAINRAVVDLTNAENYKVSIAQYGAGTQRSIHEYMWGQINQTAVAWASNTVNSVRGIMGAYTGSYATQYPMGVGSQPPVTLNYNVTGTQNAITTTQFRNLLQSASTRSGAGSAYQ
jgi:nitroreductase